LLILNTVNSILAGNIIWPAFAEAYTLFCAF